jgi:hypothetical protein
VVSAGLMSVNAAKPALLIPRHFDGEVIATFRAIR